MKYYYYHPESDCLFVSNEKDYNDELIELTEEDFQEKIMEEIDVK